MKKLFAVPSIVAGLLLGIISITSIGATAVKTDDYGRFQMTLNDRYVIVLDKVTGQTWETLLSPTSGRTDGDFKKAKITNANNAHRFQILMNDHHAFILNTETGEIWQRYLDGSGLVIDTKFTAKKN